MKDLDLNEKIRLAELYIRALSLEKSGSYQFTSQGGLDKDKFILPYTIRKEMEDNLLELVKNFKDTK